MEPNALVIENLKLKAELALLRDLFDNVGSCVHSKDLNGPCAYLNAKSCELLGASFAEVIGQDDSHFLAPETASLNRAGLQGQRLPS